MESLSGLGGLIAAHPLESAIVGLGAAGTGLGAYSAMTQAEQLAQARGQARNVADFLNNPQAVTSRAQTYYQANLPAVNQAAQNLLQQEIAPMMGMRGYDPRSGQGQLIYAQATAPLYQRAWEQALNQAVNNAMGGLPAAQTMGGFAQPQYGGVGGLGQSLQALAVLRALRGEGTPSGGPRSAQELTIPDYMTLPATPPSGGMPPTGWISREPEFSGGAEF